MFWPYFCLNFNIFLIWLSLHMFNHFQIQYFFLKYGLYFINFNATKYDFWEGGGDVTHFLTQGGGKGGTPISDIG